jgi:YHS domain-containing protein
MNRAFRATVLWTIVMVAAVALGGGCRKKEASATPAKEMSMEDMQKQATKTADAAASTEQTTCPVMDGNKIDKNVFVEYKGKKVYFCCADCKAKFLAEPEKYLAKLPQFAK